MSCNAYKLHTSRDGLERFVIGTIRGMSECRCTQLELSCFECYETDGYYLECCCKGCGQTMSLFMEKSFPKPSKTGEGS